MNVENVKATNSLKYITDCINLCLKKVSGIRNDKQCREYADLTFIRAQVKYEDLIEFYCSDYSYLNEILNEVKSYCCFYAKDFGALIMLENTINESLREYNDKNKVLEVVESHHYLLELNHSPAPHSYWWNNVSKQPKCELASDSYKEYLLDSRQLVNSTNIYSLLKDNVRFVEYLIINKLKSLLIELEERLSSFKFSVNHGTKLVSENLTGFTYKNWIKKEHSVKEVFTMLKEHKFISDSSSYVAFSNLFRNEPIIKPIIWIGNKSDLAFFIRLMHTKYQVINSEPKLLYKKTGKAFVKIDGSRFDTTKFKNDKPTNNKDTLIKIVKILTNIEQLTPPI